MRLLPPAILLATVERRADQTFYTRGGHWFAAVCLAAAALLTLASRKGSARHAIEH